MNRAFLAVLSLWRRELVHFYRQRNRVLGALGPPLFLWVLLGSGFESMFRTSTGAVTGYREYFYPGAMALVVLFTAIFSAISLIEDRRDGYLWGVLAAPIPRWTIVLGRILGGTTQGFLQGALLLAVAPWIGLRLSMGGIALVLGAIGLLALGLTAFGFLAAWHSESVAGFHAVMSLILMPMWALSGALFPAEGVPSWMRGAMLINPMRYGVAALQEGLLGGSPVPSPLVWGVLGGFGLLAFALSVWTVSRPPRGDRLPEPIEGGRSTP